MTLGILACLVLIVSSGIDAALAPRLSHVRTGNEGILFASLAILVVLLLDGWC